MPIAPVLTFKKTMTSGLTEISFDVGGGYSEYQLAIPTMTSGTDIGFKVSPTVSGTYRTLYLNQSLTSAPVIAKIGSGITQAVVGLPNLGQYFQVTLTTAMTETAAEFTVICKGY